MKKPPLILSLLCKIKRKIEKANKIQAEFDAAWKRLEELANPFRKEQKK